MGCGASRKKECNVSADTDPFDELLALRLSRYGSRQEMCEYAKNRKSGTDLKMVKCTMEVKQKCPPCPKARKGGKRKRKCNAKAKSLTQPKPADPVSHASLLVSHYEFIEIITICRRSDARWQTIARRCHAASSLCAVFQTFQTQTFKIIRFFLK